MKMKETKDNLEREVKRIEEENKRIQAEIK